MPLWLIVVLLIACIVAVFKLPSTRTGLIAKIVMGILCVAAILYIVATLLLVSGCSSGKSRSADNVKNESGAYISMMEQNYEGNNIVEVPMIMYDSEQPWLAEYGGKHPELEMLNNDIKANVLRMYNDFEDSDEKDFWIEIKTYPFTNKQMIQLVINQIMYPNYGTEGDIISYTFDKVNDEWIGLGAMLERLNISQNVIEEGATNSFVSEQGNEYVDKVEIQGFRYIDDNSADFFLKIFVINPDAEPWDGLFQYSYTPTEQTLRKLDMERPFKVSELDVMDPPLHYSR